MKQNYFTGEADVPFSSTLGETEVLYQASDKVKSMAESGSLKSMHDSCQAITESAESQYISVKDRLENIMDGLTAQEDEIVTEMIEDFPDVRTGL